MVNKSAEKGTHSKAVAAQDGGATPVFAKMLVLTDFAVVLAEVVGHDRRVDRGQFRKVLSPWEDREKRKGETNEVLLTREKSSD